MTMARTRLILVFVAALAAPADAFGGEFRHDPPAETVAGAPLRLDATVGEAWQSTLTVHYRGADSVDAYTAVTFQRAEGDAWTVEIPATAVVSPGVAYYIDSVGEAEVTPHGEFAAADRPHVVRTTRTPKELRKERDLARVDGRRSRIRVAGQLVDFGDRDTGDDRYYRIDADWAYRVMLYPLEQIRFGYTRLIGETPDALPDAMCAAPPCKPGFKVGGWAEIRLGLTEGIALDARIIAAATHVTFRPGGRAELRFGLEDGNHVAFGVEGIQDIGVTGHFRLGWDTVPRLPMAATIELTDMPSSTRPTGVRFSYELARDVSKGVRLGGRLGYQARDANVGGLSFGLTTLFDF